MNEVPSFPLVVSYHAPFALLCVCQSDHNGYRCFYNQAGTPLLSTVEIASRVLELDIPPEIPAYLQLSYPAEESTPPRSAQQPGPLLYRVKSTTGAMIRKRLDKLREVQNASIRDEGPA